MEVLVIYPKNREYNGDLLDYDVKLVDKSFTTIFVLERVGCMFDHIERGCILSYEFKEDFYYEFRYEPDRFISYLMNNVCLKTITLEKFIKELVEFNLRVNVVSMLEV